MGLFGAAAPDPKDEVIAVLKDEVRFLREKITELEGQLLAIHNAHAFRLTKGLSEEPSPPPPTPTPFEAKREVFDPRDSAARLAALVEGRLLD